jgi:hypothetical protein
VTPAVVVQAGITPVDLREAAIEDRQFGEFIGRKQLRPQAVMEVVVVVGHVIGQRRHLRLGAGMGVQFEIMTVAIGGERPGIGSDTGPLCLAIPSRASQVRFKPSNSA